MTSPFEDPGTQLRWLLEGKWARSRHGAGVLRAAQAQLQVLMSLYRIRETYKAKSWSQVGSIGTSQGFWLGCMQSEVSSPSPWGRPGILVSTPLRQSHFYV